MRWTYDDETRWAAARTRLHGSSSDDVRAIRAADGRRMGGLAVGVGLVVVVAMYATGLGGALYGNGGPDRGGAWRSVLSVAGYLCAGLGLLWALPRRLGQEKVAGLPAEAPAELLTREQRQVLDRQISGADPLDTRLLPLAFDRAARVVNAPLPLLRSAMAGVVLASLTRHGPAEVVLGGWALAAVAVALLLPEQLARQKAAGQFVSRHRPDRAD